ncbi:uncharacterized protein SCHCODRAFT_02602576 [Schizophyllum commune H4-8]|uniref:Uncharacterized protein n=1 Tax=Schizophyllum commune (strain H4-8 / FGSC 9210) TaxID=578458 RepID=D8QGK3_SCHCM|nr:uncharacterized protein SCHCODRAFT_02602576 [Schizophyllum commune H4-8]KAI5886737.1 hypothetical protein SCHCODRAFT_02602576 [Schizophyllum commune H4-8]
MVNKVQPSPVLRPPTCDDPLCSCFEQQDLINWSMVDRNNRRAVSDYSSRAFRLAHSLAKFMREQDVLPFRHVMRQTGTLISGSVAMHYFARTVVGDADLDLYTEGHHAHTLFAFVIDLGYTYKARKAQDKNLDDALRRAINQLATRDEAIYNQRAVLDAFSFVRGDAVIQVMVGVHSAIDTVLDFHSTIVMNIISHRSAYSLYPVNTFLKKTGIRFIDLSVGTLDKYIDRGFALAKTVTLKQWERMGREMCTLTRYVGDKSTWIIDLDDTAGTFADSVLFNSWQFKWIYRTGGFMIMPEIERLLFVGPRSWSQSRVFGDCKLLKAFTDLTMARGSEGRTDAEVLSMVLKSAHFTLFHSQPPSATDTRFFAEWVRTRGARQTVVRNILDIFDGEIDNPSLPAAPAIATTSVVAAKEDDDIIFLSMNFNPMLHNPALRARLQPVSQRVHNGPSDEVHTSDFAEEDESPPRKKARVQL